MADLDSLELKPGERELVERMITQRDDPAKSTVPVLVIMILVCSIIFLGSVLLVAFLSL